MPLLQRLRALLGLENKAVRADAQKAGVELLPVPVSAVIETDTAAWADAALLSPSVSAYNGIFALFGFRTGEGGLPVEVKPNSRYRDEQYKLSVTKSGVTVTAAGERKVFIWWNYPVNDMLADELFMGPCENLDKRLSGSVSGFVSNPFISAIFR